MSRPASTTLRCLLIGVLIWATGCHPTQPFYLHEDGDLSHYLEKATEVEHADVDQMPLAEVQHAEKPLTLSNPEYREIWELSLEEVVSISMANSKIVRGGTAVRLQNGQLVSGTGEGSLTLNSVSRAFASTYDPAIVESNPGNSANGPSTDSGVAGVRAGVEAALSEFDAQVSVVGNDGNGAIASHSDRPQNIPPGQAFGLPQVETTSGGLTSQVTKRSAEGTTFAFRNVTNYNRGFTRPLGFQPLESTWTTAFEVEARHPLLRGRGAMINRMPVTIARIGTDIEIRSLQANLQDMLNNIETRYWDLYLAYRNLETAKIGRDSSLVTWRIIYDKWQAGTEPVQQEAQAREQYFAFRAQVETALRELYNNENELRLLMGLSATDGRLIRPKDEPTLAQVNFDWNEILVESVARRPELAGKRWEIKQRELELIWARNQLLPQLDVGAMYRWVGLGDDLINADRNGLNYPAAGSTAFDELTEGNYQEWGLFFSYAMPVGFRRELAGVRHAQLRLAREQALLEDMELDVSHGLARAIRNLDANYQLAQTNANRWAASQKEVESVEALYRGGKASLDLVLEAQRRRAQGQAAFWSAVCEYNKAIADVHTRKGSIMDYNGIAFEEGGWPDKAYWDAKGRARERDAALYMDYGWTRPGVISRGPGETVAPSIDGVHMEMPGQEYYEEIPAPEPTPANPSTEMIPTPEVEPMLPEARSTSRRATEVAVSQEAADQEVVAPAMVAAPLAARPVAARSAASRPVAPRAAVAASPAGNPLRSSSASSRRDSAVRPASYDESSSDNASPYSYTADR